MTIQPADPKHYSQKNEEAPFSTMNDHVEDASLPIENPNEKDASAIICDDPNHPVNWPRYKVKFLIIATLGSKLTDHLKRNINLGLISFHAFMTNFIGAGIIPVYATLAEKFGIEIQDVSYMTSIHVSHIIFPSTQSHEKLMDSKDSVYRSYTLLSSPSFHQIWSPACMAHLHAVHGSL
jgi:hypothetical protein